MRVKSVLHFAATSAIALAAGGAHATTMAFTISANFTLAAAGGSPAPANQVADQVNWATFAASLTPPTATNNGSIPTGSTMTTSLGEGVKVSNSSGIIPFTTYVEGYGLWDGNFVNGTTVLSNAGLTGESTTLTFTSALSAFGVDLQTYNTGSYTFTLTAYDASNDVLGTAVDSGYTAVSPGSGNTSHEGSVSFAGITSTSANISYVTITSSNTNTHGFAIDTALIYHNNLQTGGSGSSQQTPEPGTLGLVGAGLAGLGMIRRKFRRKDRTASQT